MAKHGSDDFDHNHTDESSEDGVAKKQASGGGAKTIGFFASVCLLTNNITGPGMVQIPNIYQSAGWLFPTIVFVVVGFMCYFVSMYLAKAVTQVPGNKNGQKRVEFNELAQQLFPRWLYLFTMVALIFNFQAANISSIVVSAQTMDSTLLAAAKKTCALVVSPAQSPPFYCIDHSDSDVPTDSPFGSKYVISLGYLVTMAITIPLGLVNLDDNMIVQEGGFILLLLCIVAWTVQFCYGGMTPANVPVNDFSGYGQVLSTVIFNFGFLTTVPSWLNEKSSKVSVSTASWVSILLSAIMFLILGFMGGMSLPAGSTEDLLAALNDPATPNVLLISQIATYVFPIAALLSGIPVFSIIIRYNLINEGVPKLWANLFAVAFPWVVSLFFYSGTMLNQMITWSSAILFVFLNLMLPMMVYIARQRKIRDHYAANGIELGGGGRGLLDDNDLSTSSSAHHSNGGVDFAGRGGDGNSAARQKLLYEHAEEAAGGGEHGEGEEEDDGPGDPIGDPNILLVPTACSKVCCSPAFLAKFLLGLASVLAVACLALQISSLWVSNT